MMKLNKCLLLIAIFFISCEKKNEVNSGLKIINDDSFEVFEVELSRVSSLDTQLSNPKFIDVSDSLILIRDGNTDSDLFKVFNTSDFNTVGSFGNQGEGPGEISSPAFFNQGAFQSDSVFEYLDWGRRVLATYKLSSFLKSERPTPIKEYILPPNAIMLQRAMFLDDNYVIGSGGLRDMKLVKINTITDSIVGSAPFRPHLNEDLGNRSAGYIYAGEIAPNEEKKRIAVSTQRFKTLEIYDFDLNLISDTRFKPNPSTILGDENQIATGETIVHYSNLTSSDDYIYMLYSGNNYEALENAYYGDISQLKNSQIHVYDWEGDPVYKIKTDVYLSALSYDKNNHRIVGIAPHIKGYENFIVYFDLPFKE